MDQILSNKIFSVVHISVSLSVLDMKKTLIPDKSKLLAAVQSEHSEVFCVCEKFFLYSLQYDALYFVALTFVFGILHMA